MKEMDIIINTGTSIIQAFYEKKGSTLKKEYMQATAVAFMDPIDMKKLSLNPCDKIEVTSKWGQVTLFVDKSHDAPHEGMIFIPKGPWANIIISPETYCCNVPTFKGVPAKIRKTENNVLLVADLMRKTYKKYAKNDDFRESLGEKPIFKKME
ncbi:molybdopterin dinucleotide binding domain-containing protein [Methanosphaera sp. WGK6]|uniref:molybdopterin dinucleotide binding domain-containing protein n=1 Tax=Methanosphaera sp. WGK6 TaxID=1561964 RepID=UPI00084CB80D|nr:molybdopterin dinucleotide binding domain-containing protein [Methanosphaera sp. WGK6]OED30292.1 formylmethanofuran dehydrogenase [Methanosphaera sp. WGK6]